MSFIVHKVCAEYEFVDDGASQSCYHFLNGISLWLWEKMDVSGYTDSSGDGIVSIFFGDNKRINFHSNGAMEFEGIRWRGIKEGRKSLYDDIMVSLAMEKVKECNYENAELYILEFEE